MMKISYDAQVDALYIQFRQLGPEMAENREISEGVIADFGPDGLLAGLEILDASRVMQNTKQGMQVELNLLKHHAA
jgi:uncharacterized protein YuzE